MTGTSSWRFRASTKVWGAGAFRTMACAPWKSASGATASVRAPPVRLPPTPQKTGTSAALTSACGTIGWGVKG